MFHVTIFQRGRRPVNLRQTRVGSWDEISHSGARSSSGIVIRQKRRAGVHPPDRQPLVPPSAGFLPGGPDLGTQPARFAAHRFRIISERRFRPSAVMPPLRGAFLGAAFFPAAFFFAQYWRIASICLCRPDVTSAGFVATIFFGRPGPLPGTAGWPSRPLSAAIAFSMAAFCRSSWRMML